MTTLGVYLGLVLVGGAAPSVFAHGALTRPFELKDEIEITDDLDTKPDNESAAFDPSHDAFEVTQATLLPCVPANNVGSYTANTFDLNNNSLRPSLERLSKLLTDGYSLADCLPSTRFDGKEATSSKFTFKFDGSTLSIQVAVQKASPEIAKNLSNGLANVFAKFTPTAGELARQKIFENTSFKSKNDQVFVVTRLARADLDPLLATRAK